MQDLVYLGNHEDYDQLSKELKAKFPNIVLENGSDYIHGHRLSVGLDDFERREYLRFMIAEGWMRASLHIRMMQYDDREFLLEVLREVAQEKGWKLNLPTPAPPPSDERLAEIKDADF